jgi:hypothetical protein
MKMTFQVDVEIKQTDIDDVRNILLQKHGVVFTTEQTKRFIQRNHQLAEELEQRHGSYFMVNGEREKSGWFNTDLLTEELVKLVLGESPPPQTEMDSVQCGRLWVWNWPETKDPKAYKAEFNEAFKSAALTRGVALVENWDVNDLIEKWNVIKFFKAEHIFGEKLEEE